MNKLFIYGAIGVTVCSITIASSIIGYVFGYGKAMDFAKDVILGLDPVMVREVQNLINDDEKEA